MRFTLTASPTPTTALTVNVNVSETPSGAYLTETVPTAITIDANNAAGTLILETTNDAIDEPDGTIRATVQAGAGYSVGRPSSADVAVTDNDTKLAAPSDLTITSLPQRKARLSWMGDLRAKNDNDLTDDYVVQVRKTGTSGWRSPNLQEQSGASAIIVLDLIWLHTADPGDQGMAHLASGESYEYRIKAVYDTDLSGESDPYIDSDYSPTARIIDNPILTGGSANGYSPGPTGQVALTWDEVPDAARYIVRWGRMRSFDRHPHTALEWRPQPAETSAHWSNSSVLSDGVRQYTITGLIQGKIYAVQLNYRTDSSSDGDNGFSAREAYVWPSGTPAGGGERVATFPLNYPWATNPPTYFYAVCGDTFPSGTENEWKKFITHAISQWDLATNGLVTTAREDEDCASNRDSINDVVNSVRLIAEAPLSLPGMPLTLPTEAQLLEYAEGLLKTFETQFKNARDDDAKSSEIVFLDDYSARAVSAFMEISDRVGHGWCPTGALACAAPYYPGNPHTVDIRLMGSYFLGIDLTVPGADDRADAGEILFNSCGSVDEKYGIVLHEAGHALGITGGVEGGVVGAHPHIVGAVMWQDDTDLSVRCSPTPFDIMAIYALYQSR